MLESNPLGPRFFFLFGGSPTTTHERQTTNGKFRIRVLHRLTESPKANSSTPLRGTLHLTSGTNWDPDSSRVGVGICKYLRTHGSFPIGLSSNWARF